MTKQEKYKQQLRKLQNLKQELLQLKNSYYNYYNAIACEFDTQEEIESREQNDELLKYYENEMHEKQEEIDTLTAKKIFNFFNTYQ